MDKPYTEHIVIDFNKIEDDIKKDIRQWAEENGFLPKPITELKHTITWMLSDDYKDRIRAEYHQLRLRYEKLTNWASNALTRTEDVKYEKEYFEDCELIRQQARLMEKYLSVLEKRAKINNINL